MTTPATTPAANDNRPAWYDAAVLAYMPRLRRVAKILTTPSKQDDLVQSTIEAALRYWRSYNPAKNLGGWLVFQMRHIAFTERGAVVATGSLDLLTVPADQESTVTAAELLRAVEASPHADVMRLVATGHTSEEIATMRGVSRQRVHQKITAFRRAAAAAGRAA
jgi:DNA-directed RNA polymerase specialized sigma24 family protein